MDPKRQQRLASLKSIQGQATPLVSLQEIVSDQLVTPTCFAHDQQNEFVSDQIGYIYPLTEEGLGEPILDINDRLQQLSPFDEDAERGLNHGYDERGLLGFTFHPTDRNRLFVYYSSAFGEDEENEQQYNHKSILAEFSLVDGKADINSEKTILEVPQEGPTHNGGALLFGPDCYLYLALGDGGCCGDRHGEIGNGQDLTTLKGKVLRIDVDNGDPYEIPYDNPFKPFRHMRREIFAYGFRNPWRMSFDNQGRLWLGMVGEGPDEKGAGWESIFLVQRGGNHGWRIREGTHFFDKDLMETLHLKEEDLVDPVFEYGREFGTCVIGGYVYQGQQIPALQGKYIFGDWSEDWETDTGAIHLLTEYGDQLEVVPNIVGADAVPMHVLSFGEAIDKELYVLAKKGVSLDKTGKIYKLIPLE